jgi:hypothetical protein
MCEAERWVMSVNVKQEGILIGRRQAYAMEFIGRNCVDSIAFQEEVAGGEWHVPCILSQYTDPSQLCILMHKLHIYD